MGIYNPNSMTPRGWDEEDWKEAVKEASGWPDSSESEGQRWRRKGREKSTTQFVTHDE